MLVTRRGFLGLLASAGIWAVEARTLPVSEENPSKPSKKPVPKKPLPAETLLKGQLLIDSYLPVLKVNEGESLCFYHKKGDKVTVGYGTNVESNPGYLSDVPIFYKGKPLTPKGKKVFLATMAKKTPEELAQYTITAADAKKMAIRGMKDALSDLKGVFATTRDPDHFNTLPLCMQALCLDVFYNVGPNNFKKFPKFQAAIHRRDFDTAVKESVVYVDKVNKTINIKREWMKKRLLAIMRLVRANPNIKSHDLANLVKLNYEQKTPLMTRLLQRSNLAGELSMAEGELCQMRIQQMKKELTTTKLSAAINGPVLPSKGGRND